MRFRSPARLSPTTILAAVAGSAALAYTAYELYSMFAAEQQPDYTRVLSPPSELTYYPSSGTLKLSAAQEQAKSVIMSLAQSKAAPRFGNLWIPFAQGLVANAYGESKLNPAAVGDSGRAYGLFQLNFARPDALGSQALKYYSKQQLFDPAVNAGFFIDTCLKTSQVVAAIQSGDAYRCSDAITRYVERPKNIETDSATRKKYLTAIFGPQSARVA